jgi:hypothetical protein
MAYICIKCNLANDGIQMFCTFTIVQMLMLSQTPVSAHIYLFKHWNVFFYLNYIVDKGSANYSDY